MSDPSPNPIRRLIGEIHRRSLWQVLGIYLVGGWVAYEIVQGLTEGLGLPEWFPAFAIVLLVAGLPMVLATAFVQEGGPAGASSDSLDPSSSPGSTHPEDEPSPVRLLTWRNALVGGVGAFALWGVIAAGWLLLGGSEEAPPAFAASSIEQSIAVLPFDDLSPEGDQQYFVEGLSEEIINALTSLPDLKVAARTSTFVLAEQSADIATVASTLGVAHVLEGSVRKAGNQIRITAQLIEAESGFHLWSETFDRELDDIFAIQDEIARAVADGLAVPMAGSAGQSLVEATTENLDAYELYLQARAVYATRTGLREVDAALRYYEQAIAADPGFAPAHAGAATAWASRQDYSPSTWESDLANAESEAQAALALDGSTARAYLALAVVNRERWEWEQAGELYRRAIELSPNDPEAHHEYGEYLWFRGRCADAAEEQRRALEADPLSEVYLRYLAGNLVCLGEFDELGEVLEAWVRAGGNVNSSLVIMSSLEAGLIDEAIETARAADSPLLSFLEAVRKGDQAYAASIPTNLGWFGVSMAAHLGDVEGALERIEIALEAQLGGAPVSLWMPSVQRLLGDDPRFQELVSEIRLQD